MENKTILAEVESICNELLECLKIGEAPFVNPNFIKCFNKVVPPQSIKQGWNLIKKLFHNTLPKLLGTQYAGFWFYYSFELYVEYETQSISSLKQRVRNDLFLLNKVMGLIFFNSLVRKYVPYNFDYELWKEATNRSRSRLMKKDIDEVVEMFSKSVTDKLVDGHYHRLLSSKLRSQDDNKELLLINVLVRVYYELRHRINQVMKPIVVIYYSLLKYRRTSYGAGATGLSYDSSQQEAQRLQNFLIWFSSLYHERFYEVKRFVISKLKRVSSGTLYCNETLITTFLQGLKQVNMDYLEYLVKMLGRGVFDIEFWMSDDVIKDVFNSAYNSVPFDKGNVECFLRTLWGVYLYFTTKGKTMLFEMWIRVLNQRLVQLVPELVLYETNDKL